MSGTPPNCLGVWNDVRTSLMQISDYSWFSVVQIW
jgi:hypothetical protein